ncbi:MAG: DUF1013 domain-containing protein [Micavibrio aeruginosavorus]|uniref:DUF1013 domain-containing protein n=1 Tax=Micavibrio aeruginosavorus TaxID=349221 RepID=A0A7T5UGY3_9BACT|nr:MAG: DUF1013 domain-containing protein [Micavibrio aeruginosavorus]
MATKIPVAGLLMPKATAVWLVENTPMTFEQIGEFTGLHPIEVQALADEEVGRGIVGRNPVEHNEVTQEELDKAIDSALNGDASYRMKMAKSDLPTVKVRAKGPRYTPVTKRQDKPDAIAYILKHHPEISDAQICKLIGTTKPTIQSIRDREHPNMTNIKARHPVDCGLCTYADLDTASRKGLKAQGKTPEEINAHKEKILQSQQLPEEEDRKPASGFDFSNFLKTSSN